jgi:tRNA pseudouridine38-40 synthase
LEHTLKVTVRYDGTDFAGWQVQPGQRTVQGELEQALSQIVTTPIRITGSGRTDAGVHALGQVFSCAWPEVPDCARLQRSVSRMLSPAIRLERVEEAPAGFNACRDAIGKRYAYTFCLSKTPDPLSARYAWAVPHDVDWDAVEGLVQGFVGEHDFAGLQCTGTELASTVRTIHAITYQEGGAVVPCDSRQHRHLVFEGNGFLYKMVRNIVGSVIDVARGQLAKERIDSLLESPGPYDGYTAPAHGLMLVDVRY